MRASGFVCFAMLMTGCGPDAELLKRTVVADAPCTSPVLIDDARNCLEQGQGPDACAAILPVPSMCDLDDDGLHDDFEAALMRAYAPVFAFNGGQTGAPQEGAWPANVAHFAANSRLIHSRDRGGDTVLTEDVSLDWLGGAGAIIDGEELHVDDPVDGSDFWLCLKNDSDATRVTSVDVMEALSGGIEVYSVVHAANGTLADSAHVFVSYSMFWAYNPFVVVDNHEGDWEGFAILINRQTGAVEHAWFERHSSQDKKRFIDAAADGVVDPSSGGDAKGIRFADFSSARRHVVAYVSAGSHAMYDRPGGTLLFAAGPKDSHHGDGLRLFTADGALSPTWNAGEASGHVSVTFVNVGEALRIVPTWARFRGQWGCQRRLFAQSWPGPFGNERHARPWLERAWGSPPSAPAD